MTTHFADFLARDTHADRPQTISDELCGFAMTATPKRRAATARGTTEPAKLHGRTWPNDSTFTPKVA